MRDQAHGAAPYPSKYLFYLAMEWQPAAGMGLANAQATPIGPSQILTATDILGDLAGALSLLAAYRIGRGSRWTRARQKPARATFVSPRPGDSASGRRSPSLRSRAQATKRHGARLSFALALFSMALLLSVLAYAEVRSGSGLVEIEAPGIGLAAD